MSLLSNVMPKPKPPVDDSSEPAGSVLAHNLARLGYSEQVIKATEIANLVTEKTGKKMSRQRIANLLNAIRINPETIEAIAKGIGVKPEELTRRPKR